MINEDLVLSYLAAPYTHPDKRVVEERMLKLCKADAFLMKAGIFTVSPLMKHFIIHHADLPGDWNYWKNYSLSLLCAVDQVIVLMLDGWRESEGVTAEILIAKNMGIPVVYLTEDMEFVEVQ